MKKIDLIVLHLKDMQMEVGKLKKKQSRLGDVAEMCDLNVTS